MKEGVCANTDSKWISMDTAKEAAGWIFTVVGLAEEIINLRELDVYTF